jgi:hypothetical protein
MALPVAAGAVAAGVGVSSLLLPQAASSKGKTRTDSRSIQRVMLISSAGESIGRKDRSPNKRRARQLLGYYSHFRQTQGKG